MKSCFWSCQRKFVCSVRAAFLVSWNKHTFDPGFKTPTPKCFFLQFIIYRMSLPCFPNALEIKEVNSTASTIINNKKKVFKGKYFEGIAWNCTSTVQPLTCHQIVALVQILTKCSLFYINWYRCEIVANELIPWSLLQRTIVFTWMWTWWSGRMFSVGHSTPVVFCCLELQSGATLG